MTDYSSPGAYFVMICTAGRKCILSEITVGAIHESPAVAVRLAEAGQCVQQVIDELPERYPNLVVEKSVIMPNHVHLLVRIEEERAIRESPLRQERKQSLLDKVVGYLKRNSSKQLHTRLPGLEVWQRSFERYYSR